MMRKPDDEEDVVIEFPQVTQRDGRTRLSCRIRSCCTNVPEEMYFEVDSHFSEYLVKERADAFLVGLLPFVLENGGRVCVEAPVSKTLLHNLRYQWTNVIEAFGNSQWRGLVIEAEPDDHRFAGGHVGTGCSCGVDSCATVALYSGDDVPKGMRIDTLAFFNVGSHENLRVQDIATRAHAEDLCRRRYERARSFAEAVGMPLLTVDSNIQDFSAGYDHAALDTYRNAAAVLALGKWFSFYHCASSLKITCFDFDMTAISACASYLLECLSTESTHFHSALEAYARYERGQFIADFAPARKYLDVCTNDVGNCIRCAKCLRTMFQFEMEGILDRFDEVFDVAWFRAHPFKVLNRLMGDGFYHVEFLRQMEQMRQDGGGWRLPLPYALYRVAFSFGRFLEACADFRRWIKRCFRFK